MSLLSTFKNISDVSRAMTTRYAKSDKFRVQVNTPTSITNPLSNQEFLCEAADFPFFTFNVSEEYYGGKHVNSVNGVDYDPITLTFLIDCGTNFNLSVIGAVSMLNTFIRGGASAAKAITLFSTWSKAIRTTTGRLGYLNDYAGSVNIRLMDDSLSDLSVVTINKAYPINADTFNLTRDGGEELLKLVISFKYDSITYSGDSSISSIGDFIKQFI